MSRRANLGNYHVENLHRSLVLRDLLLDGDKTLKVLAILEYGFLWRHLKAKNSTWLITELANQRARKALFSCVVYMSTPRPRWKGLNQLPAKSPLALWTWNFFYMNFFSDILRQLKFNYTRKLLHLASALARWHKIISWAVEDGADLFFLCLFCALKRCCHLLACGSIFLEMQAENRRTSETMRYFPLGNWNYYS